MRDFKRELVEFNESNYMQGLRELETKSEKLQEFVKEFEALQVGSLDTGELSSLFNNPMGLFTSKITNGEQIKIGGLVANTEKLFELVEKPKGTIELVKKIELFTNERYNRENYIFDLFDVFNGKVSPKESTIEKLKSRHSIYIDNANQMEVLEILTELTTVLNKLKVKTGGFLTLEMIEGKFIKRVPNAHDQNNADFCINTESLVKF